MKSLCVVILAAGNGSRMRSSPPKVLQPIGGRPMLVHVLETACSLEPEQIVIVHNIQQLTAFKTAVQQYTHLMPQITWAEQSSQQGTAHALKQAFPYIKNSKRILVLYGDVPLVPTYTLQTLLKSTAEHGVGLITALPNNPNGLGRIVRNKEGEILSIIEHKDASDAQRENLKEIFSGLMTAPADALKQWLLNINNNNAQNEFYLPDIIPLARQDGVAVLGIIAKDARFIQGVNTHQDLAAAERLFQQNQANKLLAQGIHMADPSRFDLRGSLQAGSNVFFDINTVLEGTVTLGNHVHIGMGCLLRNVSLGDHVHIKPYSVIDGAAIDAHAIIGPFAHLRPGTQLGPATKIGNFVEIKNSTLGKASKANHLSYIGDTTIGHDTNIGAGTITCNYDGKTKHPTVIGNEAFIGSGCELVAPITIGDNALVGAGSTLTKNVPPNNLALSRTAQKAIPRRRQRTRKSKVKTEEEN